MKIAYVGDSFCANHNDDPYPSFQYRLEEYNGIKTVKSGCPGNPLFHSYQELLSVINEVDYIVFYITEPTRLPNEHFLPICIGAMKPDFEMIHGMETWSDHYGVPEADLVRIMNSANNYYKDVMSLEYHYMAQKGILMQIDELMLAKAKKCIWFSCFEDSMQGYMPKSGPIGDTVLRYLSRLELEYLASQRDQRDYNYEENIIMHINDVQFSDTNDGRQNHLDEENNKNMAELIMDIITSNDFTPREIKMADYFEILNKPFNINYTRETFN